MSICVVSGTVVDPSGNPLSGVPVDFNIQNAIVSADPVQGTTSTASNGTWSMSLLQGLSGVFTISVRNSNFGKSFPYRFNVAIPASSTANFSSILVDQ